ncbi:hypothetical protein SAMD00020551_4258 [Mesobacillus selenatarsenatis SF-1]|uniref:Uncharacterized protein n=1 Tax=Mesobacillus selenatarsenatis (strain DSM 18680 / JCM 14380 / FERM P-15431 / SF-1) TaxID=1321606 RepID=A0A0A8X803_MESS1|nr:hypothetical protein SAMD00020551_4258 [Mesobacillus selenatarsenatis SF-1]
MEAQSKKAKAITAKKHPVQQTDQTDITNTRRPHSEGALSFLAENTVTSEKVWNI